MFPQFKVGKSGEIYVQSIFKNLGFDCELNDVYEKRYEFDLSVKMGRLKFTIECKKDAMSEKTGNLAIETRNSRANKPSGIYSTSANVWVHLLPQKDEILAYAVNTQKLICFIEGVAPFKYIKGGGNDNSDMSIYKIETIIGEFTRFDNIKSPRKLRKVFSELLKDK